MANHKHTFDFESILGVGIDKKSWISAKRQLADMFGELKVAIADGIAEEEANKYVATFNRVLSAANLPDIGIEDLRKNFDKVSASIETAIKLINNINFDSLEDVLLELQSIREQIQLIAGGKNGIKLFDEENLKKVMSDINKISQAISKGINPVVKSVEEIDAAVARGKVKLSSVQEALSYEGVSGPKKTRSELEEISKQLNIAESNGDWEEQYVWIVKYIKAYEAFMAGVKKEKRTDPAFKKEYAWATNLYNKYAAGDGDRRNMLQNIINRTSGGPLVGYSQEPWALEKTLQEIKQILQGGLSINGDIKEEGAHNGVGGGSNGSTSASNVSIDLSGLERVLKGITYKVKIDTDFAQISTAYIETILGQYSKSIDEIYGSNFDDNTESVNLTNLTDKVFRTLNDVLKEGSNADDLRVKLDEFERGDIDFAELRNYIKKVVDPRVIAAQQSALPQQNNLNNANAETANISIDTNALIEALSKVNITADNTELISELKKLISVVAKDKSLSYIEQYVEGVHKILSGNSNNEEEEYDDVSELEQGELDDKLDILTDIAEQFGSTVTQKERNTQERLSQKDMDGTLTEKESDRLWELNDQIDAADKALEEFSETYERIVLKLENGDTVHIKPDAEGLRALARITEEYRGEYNGSEIEDISFVRKQIENADAGNTGSEPSTTDTQQQVSIDEESLKRVLESIIYNVKLSADSENNANVIDELKNLISVVAKDETVQGIRDGMSAQENVGADKKPVDLEYIKDHVASIGFQFKTLEDAEKFPNSFGEMGAKSTEELRGILGTDRTVVTQGLQEFREQLLANVTAVDEIVKKISELSAISKGLSLDQLYDEAAAVGQALAAMYDEGKTDTVEFIALQYKVEKLIERHASIMKSPEGVGRGVYSDRELGALFMNETRNRTGFNLSSSSVFDAMHHGRSAIYDEDTGKKRTMKDMAARRVDGLRDAYEYDGAKSTVKEIETLLSLIDRLGDRIFTEASENIAAVGDTQVNEDAAVVSDAKQQVAIDPEGLKSVLESVQYNVKVVQDVDSEQSKVSIDEASLEAVLNRVLTSTGEHNEPWALEATLQSTNGLLEQIVANTGRVDSEVAVTESANKISTIPADAEMDSMTEQFKRMMATINEWQELSRKLDDMPQDMSKTAEQRAKDIRKHLVSVASGMSPELAQMIGGGFEEALKIGFKGFKSKDILRYIDRINEVSFFGSVPETVEMLQGLDVENFDFDKLPIQKSSIYQLNPIFDLLKKIDLARKGIGDVGNSADIDAPSGGDNRPAYALESTLLEVKGVLEQIVQNTAEKIEEVTTTEPAVEDKQEPYALETTLLEVKGILEGINQKITPSATQEPAATSTDVGNVLATENTLAEIQKHVKNIDTKVVKGTKAKTSSGSNPEGKKNAESYDGSQYFPEKLKTQALELAKFRVQLKYANQLTQEMDDRFHELLTSLGQVSSGPDLSRWRQEFLQLKNSVGIIDIVQTAEYEQVIELQKERNRLELQYQKAQDGSILKQFYAEQLEQIKKRIDEQKTMLGGQEYEIKLAQMRAEQERKLAEERARQDDKNRLDTIKELIELYSQLGALQARIEAEDGTLLGDQLSKEYYDRLQKIGSLKDMLGIGTVDQVLQGQFDEAYHQGKSKAADKQAESEAKKGDRQAESEAEKRRKEIEALNIEISKLRAEADAVTNAGLRSSLEEEIRLREELIEKRLQGIDIDKAAEAEQLKALDLRTKAARKSATQDVNAEKRLARKQAMTGKAGSAVSRAENVWLSAQGLDVKLPAGVEARVNNLYEATQALREEQHKISTSDTITEQQQTDLKNHTVEVNKLTAELSELISEYERLSGDSVDEANTRDNVLGNGATLEQRKQQMIEYVREITNGQGRIKEFDAATGTLTYTVRTGTHEFTEYTAAVRRADNSLVSIQGSTKRTETFLEAMGRKMREISAYMSGISLISRAGQEIRKGIQYVREIDKAMTELKRVTDETEQSYRKFLNTASKTAEKLGSTMAEVIQSTAEFARLNIRARYMATYK